MRHRKYLRKKFSNRRSIRRSRRHNNTLNKHVYYFVDNSPNNNNSIHATQSKVNAFEKFMGLPEPILKYLLLFSVFLVILWCFRNVNNNSLLAIMVSALSKGASIIIVISFILGILIGCFVFYKTSKHPNDSINNKSIGLLVFFATVFPFLLALFILLDANHLSTMLTFFSMSLASLFFIIRVFIS